MEYATMKLAAHIGLDVPPVRIETILGQDVYLIERFDRFTEGENERRRPFISGLTITGAHESESSQQSYRRLAEQLRLFGSDHKKDSRELWRRMAFNTLCNNFDDHLRNHGFLWDGKGWRLSSAYDILPYPQVSLDRDLAIGVGRHGRSATMKNALSDSGGFGLSRSEAISMANAIQQTVKTSWKKVFRENRLATADIERLRNCFIACDSVIRDDQADDA
jgi:serine/threonine-protein kinase HipA